MTKTYEITSSMKITLIDIASQTIRFGSCTIEALCRLSVYEAEQLAVQLNLLAIQKLIEKTQDGFKATEEGKMQADIDYKPETKTLKTKALETLLGLSQDDSTKTAKEEPKAAPKSLEEAAESFLKGVQEMSDKHRQENYKNLSREIFSFEKGRRYWKVVRSSENGSSRSVYAFIDIKGGNAKGVMNQKGDVLKPASWKQPAKHARGNIFAADNGLSCCGPYSVAYMG